MSGYRKALRYSEEACQLEPENGDFLNTLGVAYYRVGNYERRWTCSSRSDKINALRDKGSHPTDLAFLAMAPATRPRQGSRGGFSSCGSG